jgi:hypothetical protein
LIPEKIRPESRKTFKAYDGVNNLFNLASWLLAWKVHKALINAKLEPYLLTAMWHLGAYGSCTEKPSGCFHLEVVSKTTLQTRVLKNLTF